MGSSVRVEVRTRSLVDFAFFRELTSSVPYSAAVGVLSQVPLAGLKRSSNSSTWVRTLPRDALALRATATGRRLVEGEHPGRGERGVGHHHPRLHGRQHEVAYA